MLEWVHDWDEACRSLELEPLLAFGSIFITLWDKIFCKLIFFTKLSTNAAHNNNLSFSAFNHMGKNCFCQGNSANSIQIQNCSVNFQWGLTYQTQLSPCTIINQNINLKRDEDTAGLHIRTNDKDSCTYQFETLI